MQVARAHIRAARTERERANGGNMVAPGGPPFRVGQGKQPHTVENLDHGASHALGGLGCGSGRISVQVPVERCLRQFAQFDDRQGLSARAFGLG
ncbi:MAG TPA: hypothetical protein P5552_17190, partial [Candidatus Competibacteraceae bacterium]|nr:hypothetical protein [Candidatus Competibacteraceae bacterium]